MHPGLIAAAVVGTVAVVGGGIGVGVWAATREGEDEAMPGAKGN